MDVKTKSMNVIRLWEGKLKKLDERIDEKKKNVQNALNCTSEAEDVAAALIQIS